MRALTCKPPTLVPRRPRYRRWRLAPGLEIVVRCEVDGVINNKGEDQLLSIKVRRPTCRGMTCP